MGEHLRTQLKFLNVSNGKLKKKDGTLIDAYSGYITGIKKRMDEYEGKSIPKWSLTIKDDESDEVAVVSFTAETVFERAFFARLAYVYLGYPVKLGVLAWDQNEKVSQCYIKQFGETVPKDETWPKPEPVLGADKKPLMTQGRPIMDHSKSNARIESLLAKLYSAGVKDTSKDTNAQPLTGLGPVFAHPTMQAAFASFVPDEAAEATGVNQVSPNKDNGDLPNDDLPF